MIGATAKYTLYLASRCEHFIGLSVTRWPDATNEEVIDSLVPVATGLAAVAAVTPPGVRAYHVTGPSSAPPTTSAAPASNSWCTPTTPSAVSASPSHRPPASASGCWRSNSLMSRDPAMPGTACWRPTAGRSANRSGPRITGTRSVVIGYSIRGVPVLVTDVPLCGPGTRCRCERDPPRSRWRRIDRHHLRACKQGVTIMRKHLVAGALAAAS